MPEGPTEMRKVALILFLVALACEGFGYWGLNTVEGQHAYDEMAGIVPFAAQVIGAFLLVGAVFLWWRSARIKR
jgi:lipopolysaccharide export LptBFGC system permease protein LptF